MILEITLTCINVHADSRFSNGTAAWWRTEQCEHMKAIAILIHHCRWVLIPVKLFLSQVIRILAQIAVMCYLHTIDLQLRCPERRREEWRLITALVAQVGRIVQCEFGALLQGDCYTHKQGFPHQQLLSAGQLPCVSFHFVPSSKRSTSFWTVATLPRL